MVGLALVNNTALSSLLSMDSPRGLHQGGQASAPVFNRDAQKVLAYLNVPHDAEIKTDPQRKVLLASVRDEDLSDGAQEHVGEPIADEETKLAAAAPAPVKPSAATVQPASMKQVFVAPAVSTPPELPNPNPLPARGNVVL